VAWGAAAKGLRDDRPCVASLVPGAGRDVVYFLLQATLNNV